MYKSFLSSLVYVFSSGSEEHVGCLRNVGTDGGKPSWDVETLNLGHFQEQSVLIITEQSLQI